MPEALVTQGARSCVRSDFCLGGDFGYGRRIEGPLARVWERYSCIGGIGTQSTPAGCAVVGALGGAGRN